MGIVAAGVHDGDRVSFLVNGGIGGGIIQAGVLLNRQAIEIRAQHDGRPGTVF